ncbi:MAG: DUF262 domain-containing protein [Sphingobacterium sp.]|jgi:hypothetical protein|uniref:DUF262 domain-containing protein n=1 Tax=Sphingobacterium sp. TaxID=341027 RepID=UPI0028462C27|nr:DUF262 domain-containing protein [Sphingobacterium sp.]MDR3009456.1 DUF262 domain-containing protein [Sphingobacterium sp.]
MKAYSLLQFLNEPINNILDNEEDFCFKVISSSMISESSDESTISKITIPIIQRDYAQGRNENKELREEFIKRIFFHLENREQLKLDFIYGSLDRSKGNTFLPLDGQQRLTTLYLLHWYIIKVETKEYPKEFEQYKMLLSKFSYETRDTSRRFFQELVSFDFEGDPRLAIENCYWFNDQFSLDPTIKGALNTLHTIHSIYLKSEKRDFLNSLKENIIVFYILPMDQFKLTDDLYIKLNARGKALSAFENFKADLIGFIKDDETFAETREMSNGIKLSHSDIIATKFDNTWSDLFWCEASKYLEEKSNNQNHSVDAYFFRFLHRLIINEYIIHYTGSNISKDEVFIQLQHKENKLQYTNFELYRNAKLINSESVGDIEDLLDFYSKFNTVIQQYNRPSWEKSQEFSIYKEGNYTMNERMFFDAVNQYILNTNSNFFDSDKFSEWMRIVWNLISDPDIRSIEASKVVMTVVRNIGIYSNDIYQALASGILDEYIDSLGNIHKGQLLEEKHKVLLMLEDRANWEKIIIEAESHKLYEGNVGFLLKDLRDPAQLKQRLTYSNLLFKSNGAHELIEGERYSLIRYLISQFENWDDLQGINFIDSEVNWKSHLRRNEIVKSNVLKLIEINNIELIKKEILQGLASESMINPSDKNRRLAHNNLYYHNRFHEWMQQDGVFKLKWKEDYIYVVRPNAWYSKILIGGFRNELIKALINRFELNSQNREVNSSGFYWGEVIDFWKDIDNEKKVTFNFDINNNLHIGLWGELNPHIQNQDFSKDGWKQIYSFSIGEIKSADQVNDFVEKIEREIIEDPNSLIHGLIMESDLPE